MNRQTDRQTDRQTAFILARLKLKLCSLWGRESITFIHEHQCSISEQIFATSWSVVIKDLSLEATFKCQAAFGVKAWLLQDSAQSSD